MYKLKLSSELQKKTSIKVMKYIANRGIITSWISNGKHLKIGQKNNPYLINLYLLVTRSVTVQWMVSMKFPFMAKNIRASKYRYVPLLTHMFENVPKKKEYIFWNIEDYLKLSLRSSIVLTFVSYQMALSPLINVN